MSRIHGRAPYDWSISFSVPRIDVTSLGSPITFYPSVADCSLDVTVPEPVRIQELVASLTEERGCPSVTMLQWGGYRVSGIVITEDEAKRIVDGAKRGVDPLDVLLKREPGKIYAVPIDLREFA